MLYHEVSQQEMRSAWEEGFADNLSLVRRQAMAPQLSAFEALFPTLRKGDVTTVDFMPDGSMRVSVNGTLRGTVSGSGLGAAVLSVWLGRYPADADLKVGMLGVED